MKRGGDPAEGGASFFEKRPPAFPMRVSQDLPPSVPHWPAQPSDLAGMVAGHDRSEV
jgi:hypothetical protein